MKRCVLPEAAAEEVCNQSAVPPLVFQLPPKEGRKVLEYSSIRCRNCAQSVTVKTLRSSVYGRSAFSKARSKSRLCGLRKI